MGLWNRVARGWVNGNRVRDSRLAIARKRLAPRLEVFEDREVPAITFDYGVVGANVLRFNGDATGDQFT